MHSRIKKATYSKIKAIVNIHKVLTNCPFAGTPGSCRPYSKNMTPSTVLLEFAIFVY